MKQEFDQATASGSEAVETGRQPQPDIHPDSTATEVPTATDPVAKPTEGHAGEPGARPARGIVKVTGIVETVRDPEKILKSSTPAFDVEKGSESSIAEMITRTKLLRAPLYAAPAPTGGAGYESTEELVRRIQKEMAALAALPKSTSNVLSYWALSTWFTDALGIAPALVLTGPAFEADHVLRTLRSFCRFPQLLTHADTSALKNVNWELRPTLLFFAPDISHRMAIISGCSTSRGYMVASDKQFKDYYGAKAIYLGQEACPDQKPHCCIHVHLHPAPRTLPNLTSSSEGPVLQTLQNQLLGYRLKNLARVYHNNFEAPTLTSDTGVIASALGSCIVDSAELQSELVSLLGVAADQQRADLSTSLEGFTLEAILNLIHTGKLEIPVSEIATEVNRITHAQGALLNYSPETIGRLLKDLGLIARRSAKGMRLSVDLATTTRVHQLAPVYGVDADGEEQNLHCPETKSLV